MGVSCQIIINKPKGGHKPGQAVSGVIKYALTEPLEVKSVVLSLIGKGKCKWTETRSSNNRTQTVSYSGTEQYFKESVDVIEKTSDEIVTLNAGSYEFNFEFFLPKDIPPSFKDNVGCISYKLKLKFKRPGIFKFDKKFTAEVPVYSCIDCEADGPLIFGLEKVLTRLFSKKKHVVNVKVEIDKACLTPEEKAHLTLVVTNDTDIDITAIKSEFIRYITYTADCGRTKVKKTLIKGSRVQSSSIPENAIANLSQVASTLSDMYSVNSRVVKVEYMLKVTVRLPVPHINASVKIPIVIGEKSSEINPGEEPPSYWEVVCTSSEEKVKE